MKRADTRMMWRTVAVALALGLAGAARAGSLTPPGAPAPTMNSLTELYQKLTNSLAEVQAANQRLTNALAEIQATKQQVTNTLAQTQLANQRLTNTLAAVQATRQEVLDNQQSLSDLERRLVASGTLPSTTGSQVLIPAGSFVMGACTNVGQESYSGELPQHTVNISAFYMDKYEVTSTLWREVYLWTTNRGYVFANAGTFKGVGHPVQTVTWHDCIAWCNARSQRDGFTPCYTNASGAAYTNSVVAFAGGCDWSADGYRLPTEAEWEKAARGGEVNRRFPWGDANTGQHARANYFSNWSFFSYDTSPTSGYHPEYDSGSLPYTSPVGSFAPNGYGLYDMMGNVNEWCWDSLSYTYYSSSPGSDPRGPISGASRVLRGGAWNSYVVYCRAADRNYNTPVSSDYNTGFRTVRRAH